MFICIARYPEPSRNVSLRGLQILVYTFNNVITTDVNFLSIPSSIHSIYKPKYTAKPPVCLKAILKLFLCRTRSLLIHLLPLNLLFHWSLPTSVNGRSTRLVFQSKVIVNSSLLMPHKHSNRTSLILAEAHILELSILFTSTATTLISATLIPSWTTS